MQEKEIPQNIWVIEEVLADPSVDKFRSSYIQTLERYHRTIKKDGTSTDVFKNQHISTISGVKKFRAKWHIDKFEKIMKDFKNMDCEKTLKDLGNQIKLYAAIAGLEMKDVYIKSKDTKNYSSFTVKELENNFTKVV